MKINNSDKVFTILGIVVSAISLLLSVKDTKDDIEHKIEVIRNIEE